MAGIYDTHTHLNDPIYIDMDTTSGEIIKEAQESGVGIINVVGYDVKSSKIAVRIANEYPNVYAVVGIHPNDAHLFSDDAYDQLADVANSDNVVGIGETGLDYSFTKDHIVAQKDSFRKQLQLSKKLNLPVVLHIVDVKGSDQAYLDAIQILKEEKITKAEVHSFEGSLKMAKEFVKMGYYISFSGVVTYDKSLDDVIKDISLNDMLIETDSPFSTPIPFRGQANYPKNARLVAERVAAIKNVDVDELIGTTRLNGQTLFNIAR